MKSKTIASFRQQAEMDKSRISNSQMDKNSQYYLNLEQSSSKLEMPTILKNFCSQENVLRKAKTVLVKNNNSEAVKVVDKKSMINMTGKRNKCKCLKYFIIHPDHYLLHYWNIIIVLLIVYTATIVPYRISFNDPPQEFLTWYCIDLVVDMLFTLDFIFHFFLGYYNHKNELVMSWEKIFVNYLKSWMIVDFLSIFLFEYILPGENTSREYKKIKIYATFSYLSKLPRMLRFLKLFRIFRFLRLLQQDEFL